jgi:hypothetical protein
MTRSERRCCQLKRFFLRLNSVNVISLRLDRGCGLTLERGLSKSEMGGSIPSTRSILWFANISVSSSPEL